ncbi:MAG: polyamine aminopropyltransferase [Betaproteobacteria bacterium]|nr:polyamine aminopropyltransferase [Betaproteobacteria bacterium]
MKYFQGWRTRKPEADSEPVYISEKSGVRSLHIGSDTIQSAMRVTRPNELEISYTRSMMAFLLFNPDPREVLMIGLGGGSLAKFIYHHLPRARSTAVEINPSVVAVARQFFHVPTDDERLRVIVGDGAAYLGDGRLRADVIMLDGYDAESQVEALSTPGFYRDCARALGGSGILVVNLWGGDRNYNTCVERISRAFDNLVACLPAGKPGNVAVLAFKRSPGQPRWEDLRSRAQTLEAALGLEFTRFVQELAVMNPHDRDRLLL